MGWSTHCIEISAPTNNYLFQHPLTMSLWQRVLSLTLFLCHLYLFTEKHLKMHSGEKSNMEISAPTNKVPALTASWTSLTLFIPNSYLSHMDFTTGDWRARWKIARIKTNEEKNRISFLISKWRNNSKVFPNLSLDGCRWWFAECPQVKVLPFQFLAKSNL